MFTKRLRSLALSSLLLLCTTNFGDGVSAASSSNKIQKISKVGRYLYGADGNRFYVKGVSYQQQGVITSTDPTAFPEPSDYIDPLEDAAGCTRDIPYLQQLGVNAIRVYSVNSSANHDSCMNALSAAGIYTIIDLSLPTNGSIDRVSPSWTTNLLDLYLTTIEVFSKYDNVLAYNVGNEVANSNVTTVVAPFIKAAARDVKAYLNAHNLPQLIGYASVDSPDTWRYPMAEYLSCGSDAESIDLYGLNNYEWCGSSSIQSYQGTINAFQKYNIPAYFSEFGCVTNPPRLWTEVQALFGQQMINEWSGGIAFSYFPAYGGYGLVNISSDGKSVITSSDFTRLQSQYSNLTFIESPTQSNASSSPTNYPACAPPTAAFLASDTLPPTPDSDTCSCVLSSFSCLFTPQTPNTTDIIGTLLDYGCSQLGQYGADCDVIASDGGSGTYGSLSACDPSTKLSYVMSSIYEGTNRDAVSCNFSGNATVNPSAPPTKQAAESAAQSCLSQYPAATFTPSSVALTAVATATNSGSGSGPSNGGGGGGGNKGSGAGRVVGMGGNGVVLVGLVLSLGAMVGGGIATLL